MIRKDIVLSLVLFGALGFSGLSIAFMRRICLSFGEKLYNSYCFVFFQ